MDTFAIFTWSLTAVTIFGTYLNSRQNKYGFLVWGLCNLLWLGIDFNRGIYAQAALYVVFIGFNIYGWCQWGRKHQEPIEWPEKRFYFIDHADLKEFVEINKIERLYYDPPYSNKNESKYHLLRIVNFYL